MRGFAAIYSCNITAIYSCVNSVNNAIYRSPDEMICRNLKF